MHAVGLSIRQLMRIVPGGSNQSGTFDARFNGFRIWKAIAANEL
jgi:hypothetical protein